MNSWPPCKRYPCSHVLFRAAVGDTLLILTRAHSFVQMEKSKQKLVADVKEKQHFKEQTQQKFYKGLDQIEKVLFPKPFEKNSSMHI